MNLKLFFLFLVILLVIILDQAAKALAFKFLPTVCNPGIAFGLFAGLFVSGSLKRVINLYGATIFALALILGGGISNITDRLIRGCVLDFINLKIWPAFNLADIAITLGTVILLISVTRKKRSDYA